MHLSRHAIHLWILAAAGFVAVIALMLPKPAGAQSSNGFYTTTTTSTSSTDPVTGVTTTNSTTNTPRGLSTRDRDTYGDNVRNSGSDVGWRNRAARDEDADPRNTSDMEARYPYDNTNGRNRSDVDAVRSGFDDPRNPWDGRYANDHPSNYDASNSGSNNVVNTQRGNETSRNLGNNDRYRPGNYGTRRIWRD